MARIRSIKPEFPADEKLAKVSRDARLTFVLLMTQADDEGLLLASPRQLLGTLYPFDETVTHEILRAWIDELVAADERVRWRQTTDGAPVLELPNWKKHQKIDKPTPSKIRPLLKPLGPSSPKRSRGGSEAPATSPPLEAEVGAGSGSGVGSGEVDLSEGKGESTNAVENPPTTPANCPPSAHADLNDEPPALQERAREAVLMSFAVRRFLDQFYPASNPKRRADVESQLIASLTSIGTVIRRGEGVAMAYDLSHLEQCCALVKADTLREPDKAIHVLLVKLRDTWAETRALREKPEEHPRGRSAPAGGPTSISELLEQQRRAAQ